MENEFKIFHHYICLYEETLFGERNTIDIKLLIGINNKGGLIILSKVLTFSLGITVYIETIKSIN